MPTFDLHIERMHCGACVRRVSQTLNSLPETHANSVAVGGANITTQGAPEQVLQALEAAGFPAHLTHTTP